jgi:hypothetical protein
MDHALVSRQSVLCNLLLIAALGCDSTGASAPAPTELGRAQVSSDDPNQATATVDLVLNAAPRVTSISGSVGRVGSYVPVLLQAIALDPDGDGLSFVWKSNCPGTFDRSDLAQVSFTAGTLPTGVEACSFEVDVNDGRGGEAKGTLSISALMPKINVAPSIGMVAQSTDLANAGEVVYLHVTGSDPEGEPIQWTWSASDGTLSDQTDQVETSDVHWKAPARPGVRCTITATATDPEGESTSFEFEVQMSG